MSKYMIKSINELHDEKKTGEKLEKKFKDVEVSLTVDELKLMLNMMIENRSKWKLLDYYPELSGNKYNVTAQDYPPLMLGETIKPVEPKKLTAEVLDDMAEGVFKDIISDYSYNDKVVLATRAVKPFDVAYVKSIIAQLNTKMAKKAAKLR